MSIDRALECRKWQLIRCKVLAAEFIFEPYIKKNIISINKTNILSSKNDSQHFLEKSDENQIFLVKLFTTNLKAFHE